HKPNFLAQLWEELVPSDEGIAYFDPDIVVCRSWSFYLDWMQHGVALCADVNSPVHRTSPLRREWQRYFAQHDLDLRSDLDVYVNAGFVGVPPAKKEFIMTWKQIQEWMAPAIGGLSESKVPAAADKAGNKDLPYLFSCSDQDALNVTMMVHDDQITLLGQEGMGFIPGFNVMEHAVGPYKPWNISYAKRALGGRGVRRVDKLFWSYADQPIAVYPQRTIRLKKADSLTASLVSRVIKR
ncbi:MAG: hypothetical protein WBA12_08840, partial [Catalinimonas sp.]